MRPIAAMLLGLLCIGILHGTGEATVRRVTSQYVTIQAAINASVNGDTVLVDEGTYKENIVITKKITVGSLFVLDGDTSHVSRTIIDGSQPRHADSSAVVTIDGATDTSTVVAGFTITGGKGNRRGVNYPGMAYQLITGMGIDIAGGGVRVHHNIVRGNNRNSPSDAIGGVISIFDPVDKFGVAYVIVEDNTVADNTLVGIDAEGGAFAIGHDAAIRYNVVARNSVSGPNGGIGGGFQIWNGHLRFEGNLIMDNRASREGGGLYAAAVPIAGVAPTIEMVNNILAGNSAGTAGGGLYVSVVGASVTMVNNTLASNIAATGGSGITITDGASVRALNTILWDTSGTEVQMTTSGSFAASYCDVHGGFTGTGNIDADPMFVVGDPMFNLDSMSQCIDRGIDSLQVSGMWCYAPAFDVDGHPRPSPWPPDQRKDIGAQEYQLIVDVPSANTSVPRAYVLEQNYPNPFNPRTKIKFSIVNTQFTVLRVYDLLGREVSTLVNERTGPGIYEVTFDGSNLASGVYIYRLEAGNFVQSKTLLLMK